MVMIIELLTGLQGPLPSGSIDVRVNLTFPLRISFVPGVYTAFNKVGSLNTPSPAVVQVPPEAPFIMPFRLTFSVEQMVWLVPGFTVTGVVQSQSSTVIKMDVVPIHPLAS